MKNQFQYLTEMQCNELLKLLQKFKDFFDGKLGTWKTDTVDFKIKEDTKPICSRPYPVPNEKKEM